MRKGLYIVDADELLVHFEVLFLRIEVVNLLWGVILESLLVDDAVALGAAIQAKAIVNPEESDTLLLDVTPITLGIEVNGNMMGKLIEANTTIPAKKSQIFTTAVLLLSDSFFAGYAPLPFHHSHSCILL